MRPRWWRPRTRSLPRLTRPPMPSTIIPRKLRQRSRPLQRRLVPGRHGRQLPGEPGAADQRLQCVGIDADRRPSRCAMQRERHSTAFQSLPGHRVVFTLDVPAPATARSVYVASPNGGGIAEIDVFNQPPAPPPPVAVARPHAPTSICGTPVTYDANGNTTPTMPMEQVASSPGPSPMTVKTAPSPSPRTPMSPALPMPLMASGRARPLVATPPASSAMTPSFWSTQPIPPACSPALSIPT